MSCRIAPACIMAVLFGVVATAFLSGCGSGGGGKVRATALVGKVVDAAGEPLAGVRVDFTSPASSLAATTAVNGGFVMDGPPTGKGLVVRFAKQGYVTNFRVVSISGGTSSTVQVTLNPVSRVVEIDPTKNQTVADNRTDGLNATIAFQANSLPTSATSVEITTAVQGDPSYSSLFPGEFTGIPTGGSRGPLRSFSIATITARDASGNQLQLDPSKPATLSIPVSPTSDPSDATVPLWRVNETTGIWEQVGLATRMPGVPVVYRAEVTHLSTFNLDIYEPASGLKVIAVDYTRGSFDSSTLSSLPRLPGVWVQIEREFWAGSGNTDERGELVLSPPVGTKVFTFTGSKLLYQDFRAVPGGTDPSGQVIVYVGLRLQPGDVGVIVK